MLCVSVHMLKLRISMWTLIESPEASGGGVSWPQEVESSGVVTKLGEVAVPFMTSQPADFQSGVISRRLSEKVEKAKAKLFPFFTILINRIR